ncbi:MAG: hypothetical protein A1D16_20900 [Flavihumibacter sp. CACIAM 22H1]|nr:MAG: hypothetical protein A1D16_20900 [Flavihumibacter sp. CACIAM 22H1]
MYQLIQLECRQKIQGEPLENTWILLLKAVFVLFNHCFLVFVLLRFFQQNKAGINSYITGSCIIFFVDGIVRWLFTKVNYLPLLELLHLGLTKKRVIRYILFRSLLEWINVVSVLLLIIYYCSWPGQIQFFAGMIGLFHLGSAASLHFSILCFKCMQSGYPVNKWFCLLLPLSLPLLYCPFLSGDYSIGWNTVEWVGRVIYSWLLAGVEIWVFTRYAKKRLLFENTGSHAS